MFFVLPNTLNLVIIPESLFVVCLIDFSPLPLPYPNTVATLIPEVPTVIVLFLII